MRRLLLVFLLALVPSLAFAQSNVVVNYKANGASGATTVTPATPLPVTPVSGGVPQAVNITQILSAAMSATNPLYVAPSTNGITPVVSASGEGSHVLKNAAGSLWGVYVTNLTTTAGFLQVFNATSAPGDGAVTPIECTPLPANGNAAINFNSGPPGTYSTGITAVVSSASTCFTKTTGVITAFFRGAVQ